MYAQLSSKTSHQRFLFFRAGSHQFATDIENIQDLEGMQPIRSPFTPKCGIRGEINVRGAALPIVDLRKRFGTPFPNDSVCTCIILVQSRVVYRLILGMVVDEVSHVSEIPCEDISLFGCKLADTSAIRGVYQKGLKHVFILDPYLLMNDVTAA